MNEEQFVSKVTEFIDQVKLRLKIFENEVKSLNEWVETLDFFVRKRKEVKK